MTAATSIDDVEQGPYSPAGSVLSGAEIVNRCRLSKPLIRPLNKDGLKPAAYDVRIARDGMITPDGGVFKPGHVFPRPLILNPGDTAFVSTFELFEMPQWLTGTISIKAALARQGVLLLTGLVVDPHYREGGGNDGRLHFTLANLGGSPVVIEPEHTLVVTIQFVRTSGSPSEHPTNSTTNLWENTEELMQLKGGLGFVRELRDVKATLSTVEERLEGQSKLTEYALIAGLFLLATTILGVSAASILAAASDHRIVQDVKSAIPSTSGKRVFVMVVTASIAWMVFSLSSAMVSKGSTRTRTPLKGDPLTEVSGFIHRAAIRSLHAKRSVRRTVCGVLSILAVTACVYAVEAIGGIGVWWPVIPVLVSLVALLLAYAVQRLWMPFHEPEIKARVAELYAQASGAGGDDHV